jgi:Cu+-exporting ATPase
MAVSNDSRHRYHYAGTQYYFCSEHCFRKFKEHPEEYLVTQAPRSAHAYGGVSSYTCPMHPEVVQNHPGNCPKCGMALEPATLTVEEKNVELIDMSRRFWVCTAFDARGSMD